jgi:hypothetical protein
MFNFLKNELIWKSFHDRHESIILRNIQNAPMFVERADVDPNSLQITGITLSRFEKNKL